MIHTDIKQKEVTSFRIWNAQTEIFCPKKAQFMIIDYQKKPVNCIIN